MYHILVVDDEPKIRAIIRKYAEFEGYRVSEAVDGMQAVEMCRKLDFDAVIMDIMMPELDGFSAVREIRKEKQVPFIMLSARGEEYDKIHGFELGIDDYMVKPFSPRELMMRLNVIITRNSRKNEAHAENSVRELNGISIDTVARIVYIDGEKIDMSPKEYDLLMYFADHVNVALTREQILNSVWGYDFFGDDRTLDTHVKMLRNKIGDKYRNCIVTLRGVGYRFEIPQ